MCGITEDRETIKNSDDLMFEYFVPVFYTMLHLIVPISLGFILKRFGTWPEGFFSSLSRFLVRIALPIYQFSIVSKTDYAELRKSWPFFAASFIAMALSIGISYMAVRPLSASTAEKRLITGFSGFGNAGYIPLSIIEIMPITMPTLSAYFGVQAPAFYVSVFVFCQSPLLWTAGNFLITGKGKRPKFHEILGPPMIGILCGMTFLIPGVKILISNPRLPLYHVYNSLDRFGTVAIPVILVCLGTMIADIKVDKGTWKGLIKLVLPVMGMRFLVLPGLFFMSYLLFLKDGSLTPAQCFVLFLETSTPPATNLSIMAAQAGINENKVAFVIMTTYLVYLVILPLYMLLFLSLPGILPGG